MIFLLEAARSNHAAKIAKSARPLQKNQAEKISDAVPLNTTEGSMCKCQTRWGEASACNLSSVLHSHVNLLPPPLRFTATAFISTGQAL